ncbi:MAG: nucleotide exchange factor GrpE [Microthrixaceae bacterium]
MSTSDQPDADAGPGVDPDGVDTELPADGSRGEDADGPLAADATDEAALDGVDPDGAGSTADGTFAAAVASLDMSSEEAMAEAVELAQRLEAERDDYLDHLRRLKADYENYKRRVDAQRADQRAQAALELVRELLPVLDAFDAALTHGNEEIVPLQTQLVQTLTKQGLEVVADADVPFDPNVHEAVMHEDGDGEAVVAEVLRTGYLWNGRVARAAMVKVRG